MVIARWLLLVLVVGGLAAGCDALPGPPILNADVIVLQVTNDSPRPIPLTVAMPGDERRVVGSVDPPVVPPGTTVKARFLVPRTGNWAIFANGGELIRQLRCQGAPGQPADGHRHRRRRLLGLVVPGQLPVATRSASSATIGLFGRSGCVRCCEETSMDPDPLLATNTDDARQTPDRARFAALGFPDKRYGPLMAAVMLGWISTPIAALSIMSSSRLSSTAAGNLETLTFPARARDRLRGRDRGLWSRRFDRRRARSKAARPRTCDSPVRRVADRDRDPAGPAVRPWVAVRSGHRLPIGLPSDDLGGGPLSGGTAYLGSVIFGLVGNIEVSGILALIAIVLARSRHRLLAGAFVIATFVSANFWSVFWDMSGLCRSPRSPWSSGRLSGWRRTGRALPTVARRLLRPESGPPRLWEAGSAGSLRFRALRLLRFDFGFGFVVGGFAAASVT